MTLLKRLSVYLAKYSIKTYDDDYVDAIIETLTTNNITELETSGKLKISTVHKNVNVFYLNGIEINLGTLKKTSGIKLDEIIIDNKTYKVSPKKVKQIRDIILPLIDTRRDDVKNIEKLQRLSKLNIKL